MRWGNVTGRGGMDRPCTGHRLPVPAGGHAFEGGKTLESSWGVGQVPEAMRRRVPD